MAITKDSARQWPLVAHVDVTYDDLTSGSAAEAIDLPANAILIDGWVDVTTVFNSATSDVLDVGDGADVDRYTATQLDLTALGTYHLDGMGDVLTVFTAGGFKYTAADTIDVIWTGVGTAPTTGAFTLYVMYYIDGRDNENQG